MKATGIVRRIDDLGRLVIPKEIRRTMRINEGDPMELFIDDGAVCFKKYQPCVVYRDVIKDLKGELLDDYDIDTDKKRSILSKIIEIENLLKEEQ